MAYITGKMPEFDSLPRFIPRDQAFDLTLNVFLDDSATKDVLASGTITLYHGTKKLVDAQAIAVGGTYSGSYSLAAAITKDETLTDQMLELWTVVTSTGETVTIRKSGHLVRHLLYPIVTDSDLVARHNQLDDIRPSGLTNWLDYLTTAWEVLNRDLIKRGKRPELVLDSYALFDLHVFKALQLIFRDMTTFVGDGRYQELFEYYTEKYREEWDTVQLHYDSDQDGVIDQDKESARPALFLNAPAPGFLPNVLYGTSTWTLP